MEIRGYPGGIRTEENLVFDPLLETLMREEGVFFLFLGFSAGRAGVSP